MLMGGLTVIVLASAILPLLDRNSPEFVAACGSIVFAGIFLVLVILLERRLLLKKKDAAAHTTGGDSETQKNMNQPP